MIDIVDRSEKILGRSYTVGWLLDSLRQNDREFGEKHGTRSVNKVTSVDISGGKGFASVVIRCTLTFVDSNDEEDVYHTIVKIPGIESFQQLESMDEGKLMIVTDDFTQGMTTMHEFECRLYNDLAPKLDVPMPRVFKTADWILHKQDGVIHMEDLTLRGCALGEEEPINLAQIKEVTRILAKMHKQVLFMDESEWKGKYSARNKTILSDFIQLVNAQIPTFLENVRGDASVEPMIEKCRKLMSNSDYYNYVTDNSCRDLGIPSVLVHGDMWGGNIMFEKDEHGERTNKVAAVIDWQLLHEGSPMSDMARLITVCADGTTRRRAEQLIFDYYLECLQREFGDRPVPYTTEQLRTSYHHFFVSQVFYNILCATFQMHAMEKLQSSDQALGKAYLDVYVLRAVHGLEDVCKLMEDELKELYDKFGR